MLGVLLVCTLVSGSELTFQYQLYRRSNEPCKLCYGDDCLQMQQARCEYYVETDRILHEEDIRGEDSPVVRAEVDRLMYRFMERATATQTDCVPLVSGYTDCTKENICTGCKTCSCDTSGSWNCTITHKCRADVPANVDHRMLVLIMETLDAQKTSRMKRSIEESLNKLSTNKISFEEISRWMMADAPILNIESTQSNVKSSETESTTSISETTTEAASIPDTAPTVDYLGFDEVLNNIAVDNKTYSRRKPLNVVHNDSIAFDYMIFDEDNATEAVTDKLEYENMDNKYAPTGTNEETEIVIDLLESAKKNQGETFTANWTDYTETNNKINAIDPSLDYIDNFVLDPKNIMKRDISIIGQLTEANTEYENITNNVHDLRNSVLLPLSNIINDKQKELEELLRVSENLIKIMRTYKNQSIPANNNDDINSSISIYNFELTPELETEFRRSDSSLLRKYVMKLKRDVYEVIRDIAGIQKLKGATNIPQDLKLLLRAMKHYVRSQAKFNDKEKSEIEMTNNRRTFENTFDDINKVPLATEFISILKVIDQNVPQSNALAPLSPTSRKIIHRVIKNNYINEFSVIGLRVFDPEYNLTIDLQKIGSEWPRMTNAIAISADHDKLHSMKLLHLGLSTDIVKMNDALALLEFAYSRRMILVEGNLGGEIIERINKGLKAINDKIKVIIKLHNYKESKQKSLDDNKKIKKQSFLKKLKNILKSSKTDILSMLKKKVPKKDIVKSLAKKKIDEMTRRRFVEFEDTMKKWQNKLNLVTRDKRSALDNNYKNRMKNILPKYLRGKLKPAMAAKVSKKSKKHRKPKNHYNTTIKAKSLNTSIHKN